MIGRRGATALLAPALLLGLMVAPATSPAVAEELPATAAQPPLPSEGMTDQIIVTTSSRAVSDAAVIVATEEAAAEVGVEVTADIVRDVTRTTSIVKLDEALPVEDVETLASELASADVIVRAEPDIIMQPAVTLPNDPYLNSPYDQWGLWQSPSGGVSTKAPQAWPSSRGGGVVVAVLDTGITAHPDLDANVVPGYDFISFTSVSNDGDGRDPDPADPGDYDPPYDPYSSWHGTHVAGTIAAVTDNGIGVAGVAPDARIQPVRVLGTGGGYLSDISDAVRWAAGGSVSGVPANPTPARVINLSLGGSGSCWSYMQDAVNTAVGLGSVVVVSAGNSNADAVNSTPANCDNVITVAAHSNTGQRAVFSNYGATVEISGPGVGVYSTLNSGATTPGSPSYGSYSGTSMSAPHVAGVAALLIAAQPSITPSQVTTILQSTAQPFVSGSTCISLCGSGYVDAAAAVASVAVGEPTGITVTPGYEELAVSWTAPAGILPTHYDVEHSIDGTTWTADDSTLTTSTAITGLNPADAYLVRVRSATADDSSAWVATNTGVNPLARTTPGPTGAVTGLPDDDTTVTINWAAPADNGGHAIEYYTVEHSTDDSTWIADDTTTSLTATIDGLTPSAPHRFRIAAVNVLGAGVGVLSGLITPRTVTVPGAPQTISASASNSTLTVTWAAPADDGGRPVTSYAVQHSTDDSTWTTLAPVAGTSTTIAGLINDQAYSVRVAATSAMGTGAWASTTGTPVAPPPPPPPPPAPAPAPAPPPPPPAPVTTAPGAPVITEIGADDRTVMALWQASDDTGGEEPSEFVVELAGPDGTQTRTTPITYEEFGDLVNGAAYRVRVAATNSAGTGDFSGWSDEVTPFGLAAAPTGLTGTAFDGGVDLRWVAPDDTGGAPIEDYVVSWVSDGVEVALTTEEAAIRLETLANGTRYDFRVAAQTEAGVGEWSTTLSLTPRAAPVTAPEGVAADRTGRRLIVTWSAPSVGDPKRYVVAASTNGGPYRIKRSTDSTRVTLSLSKRTATIAVRVLAVDSYGRGPWSEPTQTRIKKRR